MLSARCALGEGKESRWWSSAFRNLLIRGRLTKSEGGAATVRAGEKSTAPAVRAIKKVGLFSFVFVMYSYNTAGPFGLEDQVRTSGPGMSLLYQLIIPFFW